MKKSKLLITIGTIIRIERLRLGLSQEELAERCNLHRTYIGMIERAEKNITLENINKLASGLEVSLAYLFSKLDQSPK